MSSPQIQTIVADEICLAPSPAEPDLLREIDFSFREWSARSSVPAKELPPEGTIRIDGYMAGLVHSEGKLILNQTGVIDGDLFINEAIINGTLRGDIHATTRVELGSSACVIGDIETAQLLIQPGAIFEGRCAFISEATTAREVA